MTMTVKIAAALAIAFGATPASPQALPPIPDLSGKVLTVAGPVDPATLGETLMHEHVFIDFQEPEPVVRTGIAAEQAKEKLALANIARARLGGPTADNGMLTEFDEILAELNDFKYAGGGTVVDVSNAGLGRDPGALLRVSRASGLHVVMGAGWYAKPFHPLDMGAKTVEDMTATIVRDIVSGADGTRVRSGVIGEVGIDGRPLTPNEIKSIRASARASRLTGAPISFHSGGYREEKLAVLDIVAAEGVDLAHVVMGHSNGLAVDLPLARRVLARGVFVEFDYLGAPGSPGGYLGPRTDRDVAKGIAALIREGYADRILLGHDICTRIQLKKYGGMGYTYIADHFLPVLRELGVGEADIRKIMVDNPRRALTFAAPRPLVRAAP